MLTKAYPNKTHPLALTFTVLQHCTTAQVVVFLLLWSCLCLFVPPDRRYIKWLSLVTVAFNYNVWLVPARLCFPYHTPQAIPFWILFDIIFDLVNIIDIVIFQQRLQFVKGGDIIVSEEENEWICSHVWRLCFATDIILTFSERPGDDQS